MQNQKYCISFFDNDRDRLPKRAELTFDELKIRLNESAKLRCTNKNELEAMICGEFVQPKRIANHLGLRSIITYDVDNYKHNLEKLIKDCEECLEDIKYLYYTTFSNSFSNPRIRLLIFPTSTIPAANYADVSMRLANDLFSEDILQAIDKSCYSAMQLMYLPSLKGGDFKCYAYDNNGLDIGKYLNSSHKDKFLIDYKNVPLPKFDEEQVKLILDRYEVEETGYDEWFKVAQALHHQFSGGEIGMRLFANWSAQDRRELAIKGYDKVKEDAQRKYKTIKSQSENPITLRSLIKIVNDKKKLPAKYGEQDFVAMELSDFIKKDGDMKLKKLFPVGVKSTFKNFKIMCEHYDIKIMFDIITKENVNNLGLSPNSLVSAIKSVMTLNNMLTGFAIDYINHMAEKNKINTFKNAMKEIIWDGVDRLEDFYNTVKVADEYVETRNLYLFKWLQQMLYLTLHHEGRRKIARNLLVFQSDQSGGKSTWFRSLLPDHLSDFIGEGLRLNTNDDMSILSCIKNIFVELSELEQSFKATDINQFKAFFGRTKDVLNRKYIPFPVTYTRTTSFLGTVNDVSFLKDKTGSTRFLVLPVEKLDGFHNIDMMQLYKQIESMGYINFELTKEEQEKQKLINEDFQQPDLMEEQFINVYETEFTGEGEYLSCTEILEQIGYMKRDINHMRRCDLATTLRKYNFDYRKKDKKWEVKRKQEKENKND